MDENDQSFEIARILESHRASLQRMDDYRAVFVEDCEFGWSSSNRLMVMYRKGNKFRTDTDIVWAFSKRPRIAPLNEGEDIDAWWRNHAKDLVLVPSYINLGPIEYNIDRRFVTDPDGSQYVEIGKARKQKNCCNLGQPWPAYWSCTPEFACRPPLGLPSETAEIMFETNPTEGPAGTILLNRRDPARQRPPIRNKQGQLIPPAVAWRYWFDPAREYAVVREDLIVKEESGDLTPHTTIIEKMAQSPNGVWHATRIRRKRAIGYPDGKRRDQVNDLYLDFNADLPDSLFDLPAKGQRIYCPSGPSPRETLLTRLRRRFSAKRPAEAN